MTITIELTPASIITIAIIVATIVGTPATWKLHANRQRRK